MDTVLDLDLDFFVDPVVRDVSEAAGPPSEEDYSVSTLDEVREFLEARCGLNETNAIPGREFVHHVHAFWTWKEWIEKGELTTPFQLVHVDAHSDMGWSLAGDVRNYICGELLKLPRTKRTEVQCGAKALNSGSYLSFAAACGWLSEIIFVVPSSEAHESLDLDGPTDLEPFFFKNGRAQSKIIQLRGFPKDEIPSVQLGKRLVPYTVENEIPVSWYSGSKFRNLVPFTRMVVAHSPAFGPPSVTSLLPTIRGYFQRA